MMQLLLECVYLIVVSRVGNSGMGELQLGGPETREWKDEAGHHGYY
jgi:hypothetical protein